MGGSDLIRLAAGKVRESGKFRVTGISGSRIAYFASRLLPAIEAEGRTLLLLAGDGDEAVRAFEDLCFFLGLRHEEIPAAESIFGPVCFIPEDDFSPIDGMPPDRAVAAARIAGIYRLLEPRPPAAVVSTWRGFLRRGMPAAELRRLSGYVLRGADCDREHFLRGLVEAGYERVASVTYPGEFSVRGHILDVFSPLYKYPARIELFGNEVDGIRSFDPATQRAVRDMEDLHVCPAGEAVVARGREDRAEERIRALAEELGFPRSHTDRVVENVRSGRSFLGVEALMPALHERLEAPIEIAAGIRPCVVAMADPGFTFKRFDDWLSKATSRRRDGMAAPLLGFPPEAFYLGPAEVETALRGLARLELCATSASAAACCEEAEAGFSEVAFVRAGRAGAAGDDDMLAPLAGQLKEWRKDGLAVVVACPGEGGVRRFSDLVSRRRLGVRVHREPFEARGAAGLADPSFHCHVFAGRLSEGFASKQDGIVFLAEADVFGKKAAVERKPRGEAPFSTTLEDLDPGDLVVHSEFGIGRYQGLRRVSAGGRLCDMMSVEYRDGDVLYVPVTGVGMVKKYVSPGGGEPSLDRLGGEWWKSRKARVKEACLQFASELLRLYAARDIRPGVAYGPPDDLYREFEMQFDYEETPDQAKTTAEIMDDLQKPKPMDRLLCGDVGYGKTEVAMRAAFKVVEDGKQVVVLAPTTVLAQQHYRTFSDRFRLFPVNIEVLSRFRSDREQEEVVRSVREGRTDIVIGTHRLLSTDVDFARLGLLIVDEEHRFGVRHKERLKKLSRTVDCLSMSATPIPRTLHLSFVGLRDISIITSPPAGRQSVKTTVARFSPRLVRDAVLDELGRGGQIFVVHNRVASMDAMEDWLRRLVPEARLAVAHGRMEPSRLERIMVDFVDRRHDVLLATAIIESGIDIPAANTLIVNRADRFGLAQLYQLRGRVGRSVEKAYAYFLVPARLEVTEEARRRLDVLARFSELGSGFSVASRDLDLRGAGDIIGEKQFGQVAAVGYEMYCELLREAVERLRSGAAGEAEDETEPELRADLCASIPEDYVPEAEGRLAVYGAFGSARSEADVEALLGAVADRYGRPPREVGNLAETARLRILGRRLGLTAVHVAKGRVALTFSMRTRIDGDRLARFVAGSAGAIRMSGPFELVQKFAEECHEEEALAAARKLLQKLTEFVKS